MSTLTLKKISLIILLYGIAQTAGARTKDACAIHIAFPPEEARLAYVEQTENEKVERSTDLMNLSYVLVNPNQAIVREAATSGSVRDLVFDEAGQIRWFQPINKIVSADLPYSNSQPSGTVPALLSASRSVFVSKSGKAYSIKVPDAIAGGEPEKADLSKSVIISLLRTKAIQKIDALIGKDPELILLLDVMSVADKQTGNGFVVRDLTPLQDGRDSIPGFALGEPFRKYVKKHGLNMTKAVKEHFSELFGRVLAKMVLRYGLIMIYPHDQNYLLRFVRTTGRPLKQLAWRDLSDTQHVIGLMDSIGLEDIKEETLQTGLLYKERVTTEFFFNGGFFEYPRLINRYTVMNQVTNAFTRYIYDSLGKEYAKEDLTTEAVSLYLLSEQGKADLKKYHQELRRQHAIYTSTAQ